MFGATDDEVCRIPEDPSAFREGAAPHEDDALPAGGAGHPGLRAWLACTLLHRRAHRWFPRYLGGYGRCSTCGREWH